MSLSPEHRAKLIADTRSQAVAFLDDMRYLRDMCGRTELSAPMLRRTSSVLRRLLIERDITQVAAARVGRIRFSMPDNRAFYNAAEIAPLTFFASGGFTSFGIYIRGVTLSLRGGSPRIKFDSSNDEPIPGRLDNFLSQHVISYNGLWASRADVVKFVANVASGVHSGSVTTQIEEMLSYVQRAVWYSRNKENSAFSVTFDMHALQLKAEPAFRYSPENIDPTLIEILSTIMYMTKSRDIIQLEETIERELLSA